ncbi:unnamed protein product [Closterium sp. Yama58-4]|nr:unnamed protein product [Closterium sp. Yama58-4]
MLPLFRITSPGETCGRAGSSCEIQQNASSFFCRALCFDFCASCIPINALCLLVAAAAVAYVRWGSQGSKLQPLSATASRVFSSRSRGPRFPVSLVAQATGGWSEVNRVEEQGWSSSSSSGGQRYKAVNPLNERQVWFVVRRGNDELSANFQKEVAKLWSIRHTNVQRLLGHCWEKHDTDSPAAPAVAARVSGGGAKDPVNASADGAKSTSAETSSVADHAVEQAEEQVLVFEWVPGGNLHSRLVAAPTPAPAPAAGKVIQPPANHAYMDPILHASARTTPSTDVFSIGVVMLQLITGRPALIPKEASNDRQGSSSGTSGGSSSNSISSISTNSYSSSSSGSSMSISLSGNGSVHIRDWAQHLVTHNMTDQLRAAHLPWAPDAIVLPMVRLALSCTASDPLSRPTVTDLLRSIKALKRSLSALPRPALPANTGTSGDGETAGAAGGVGTGEQQSLEDGYGLSGGFSQNALDSKLTWLVESEDSGRFVTDV